MTTLRYTRADLEVEIQKLDEQVQEAKRKHRRSSHLMERIELIKDKIEYMKRTHREYLLDPCKSDALKKMEYNKAYYAKKKEAKQAK
jgi:hypothetical protein